MASTTQIQEQYYVNFINEDDLTKVLPHIEKTLKKADKKQLALKILIKLSSTLATTSEFSNSEKNNDSIAKLSNLCCESIKCDSQMHKNFLNSLYHICKYFIDQGKIEPALILNKYVVHTAADIDASDDVVKRTCYASYRLIYNLIIETAKKLQPTATRSNWKNLLDSLRQSLELLACLGDAYGDLFFSHIFSSLGVEKLLDKSQVSDYQEEKLEFQMSALDAICNTFTNITITTKPEFIFKVYITLITSMLKECIDRRAFDKALVILQKVYCIKTPDSLHAFCISFYKKVLGTLLNLSSIYGIGECNSILEYLKQKGENHIAFHYTCSQLAFLISSLHSYWLEIKNWPVDVIISVCELMLKISAIIQSSRVVPCILPSGGKCPLEVDTRSACGIIIGIMAWVSNLADCQLERLESILSQVSAIQDECIKLVKIMKAGGCLWWKENWKILAIRSHNIGCFLRQRQNLPLAEPILLKHCQAFLELGTSQEKCVLFEDGLWESLQSLARCYIDLMKFKKALICVAVAAVLSPKDPRDALKLWATIKKCALVSEEELFQTCTVYDIIVKDKAEVKELFPAINNETLERANIWQLLVLELQAYNVQRANMRDAIFAATKRLASGASPGSLLGQGVEILLANAWWQTDSSEFNRDYYNVYIGTVTKLKQAEKHSTGDEKLKILVNLGNLYYYYFLGMLKVTRCKQKAEVESLEDLVPKKVDKAVERGEVDREESHTVCDIIPAYINLNIAKEAELLELLKRAVVAWSRCLEGIGLKCSQDMMDVITNMIPNIETCACMYTLYGCEMYSMKAWMLLYKFGDAIGDSKAVLLGLSHVLESCDDLDNELWIRAKNIALDLQNKEQIHISEKEVLQKYWLCRSHSCWKNAKHEEGLQLLLEFKSAKTKQDSPILKLLHVRSQVLLSRYLSLPSRELIPDQLKDEDYMLTVNFAFYAVRKMSGEIPASPSENCQLHCLIIETTEWIGELYLRLKFPRDVRCYLKAQVVYTQMMALSTRTVQFLSKLAQVDVLCCKLADSQVKLLGMYTILQLNDDSFILSLEEKKKKKKTTECRMGGILCSIENLNLNTDTRGLATLNVPQSRSPMGSPVLRKAQFLIPPVANHGEDCECFPCNSITLQTLLLEVTTIQAQVHALEDDHKLAQSFFSGGLRLAQTLQTKQTQALSKFSCQVFTPDAVTLLPLQNEFFISISKLLFQYSGFLEQHGKCKEALKLNESAAYILREMQEVHAHIAHDILVQESCLLQAKVDDANGKHTGQAKKREVPSSVGVDVRTPRNPTISTMPRRVVLEETEKCDQEDSPPPRRMATSIVANLFPDSNCDTGSKPRRFFKTPCRTPCSRNTSSLRKRPLATPKVTKRGDSKSLK